MRPRALFAAAPVLALLLSAGAAAQDSSSDWLRRCREDRNWGSHGSERHCELRESRLSARPRLSVDGGDNGGVTVTGWNEGGILVRARVQANARSREEAQSIAQQVRVTTEGGEVHATGPERREGRSWSVSYEVFVPRRTGLDLETTNGGIGVERVSGEMRLQARNGPVSLRGVGGNVHARTANGPLRVVLEGDRWAGQGLDAETRNGPVTLEVPDGYSASLETGTVNGPMNFDIPVRVQGRISRRIQTELGRGGAPIRVVTTNGPVTVRGT
jgi:hypothetical protein